MSSLPIAKSNFFVCRPRVALVLLLYHSCRTQVVLVLLVFHSWYTCVTRVALMLVVLHSCCTCVACVRSGTRAINQLINQSINQYFFRIIILQAFNLQKIIGKKPKYSQPNIIQDKTSKYETNRMGKRNLSLYI